MEDDIDIYEDLPSFNIGDNEDLVEKNNELARKCSDLEKEVADLTAKLESIQKINKNLEVNLSSLLKTAKAEVSRKDKIITETRRQLDSMLFRRDNSTIRAVTTEAKKKSEFYSLETRTVYDNRDSTEFVYNDSLSTYRENTKETKSTYRPDKIVSTVFGERLQKRLLEEQEAEQKQKVESNVALGDAKSMKHVVENNKENSSKCNIDNNKENQSNVIQLNLDAGNVVITHDSVPNLNSTDSSNLLKNENSECKSALVNRCERKRSIDDRVDILDCKRRKVEGRKEEYGENRQHTDNKSTWSSRYNFHSYVHARHTKDISNRQERKYNDVCDNDDPFESMEEYHVSDEYRSNSLSRTTDKQKNICEEESAVYNVKKFGDRHNRIASRLKLLAEGIEPDFHNNSHSSIQEFKQVNNGKRKNYRSDDVASRSKSRDCDSRHDKGKHYRLYSRTPDRRYNDKGYGRSHYSRYIDNKDKYDKRRDLKNKDRNNLNEFSREVYDLREKIDYKFDEKDSSRDNNFNRSKRYQDRRCKDERYKTSDTSSNGTKDVLKTNVDQHSKRSRSHEKHSGQSTKVRSGDCNVNLINKSHKSNVTNKIKKEKKNERIPRDKNKATETISLRSLEDGEIVDTPNSSPRKTVGINLQTSDKLTTLHELKLINSDKIDLNVDRNKSIIVSSVDNTQSNNDSIVKDKHEPSTIKLIQSKCLTDSLDFSKNIIIENRRESIKNGNLDKNSKIPSGDINKESKGKEICNEFENSAKNLENTLSDIVIVENLASEQSDRCKTLSKDKDDKEKLTENARKNLESIQPQQKNVSEKINVVPSGGDIDRCKKSESENGAVEKCLKLSSNNTVLKSAYCLKTTVTKNKQIYLPLVSRYSRNRKESMTTNALVVNCKTVQDLEMKDSPSVTIIDSKTNNVAKSEPNSNKEMKAQTQQFVINKFDSTGKSDLADRVKLIEHNATKNVCTTELNLKSMDRAPQISDQNGNNVENRKIKSNDNYSEENDISIANDENTVIGNIKCTQSDFVKKVVERNSIEDCKDKDSDGKKETVEEKAETNYGNSKGSCLVSHKQNQEEMVQQNESKKEEFQEERKDISKVACLVAKSAAESNRAVTDTSKCLRRSEVSKAKTMLKTNTGSDDNIRLNKSTKYLTRSKERSKSLINHCKVIIVARRKKPVQLEDSSASMTVLLTNNGDVNNSI